MYISDVADAESICLGYFARIDDETFFFQLGVERVEIETCFRIKKRGDDGRLEFVRQQGFEAECAQSFYNMRWFSQYLLWRATIPPSSSSSASACLKALTTWVGEVNLHLPCPFSIVSHWS